MLTTYAPATRDEEVEFETYYGWALYEAGEYAAARTHLLRGLRRSRPASRSRGLLRGLLGEVCLRTGRLDQAVRCAHRALSDLPREGDVEYVRTGHLAMLGRIYRRQGHLTHAIETYRDALALIDDRSPHWTAINANLSLALLQRGHVHEADALVRARRRGTEQADVPWATVSAEAQIALALGDVDRAERVLDHALSKNGDSGERVRMVLLELQTGVLRARGRWIESERILQAILDRCEFNGRYGDMVACSARALAESLEGQNEFERALEPAQLAVKAGSVEDRIEWAAGLHVLGRCLAALGRANQARRAFREALGLHERTQFAAERARLEQTLLRLGFGDLMRARAKRTRKSVDADSSVRIGLLDGRFFLSRDRRFLDEVRSAAASELPVLLEGETGTGKELVARMLHEQGPLANAPFVVADCATLSPELADVELFGAARGAYTGAHRDRGGLIARADGGTLFLDELPELSSSLQAKLLRIIQEGTYRRVGEDSGRRAQVRFIAATNRRVEELLRDGALREDLFYRLNGHRFALEPLRQRRQEIVPLAEEFVRRCGLAGITPAALEALTAWDWPGNVRQLEMVIRLAACRREAGGTLDVEDLALSAADPPATGAAGDSLRAGRIAWERSRLSRALAEHGGVVARAARSLGLTRQAFYVAMRRTGLFPVNRR